MQTSDVKNRVGDCQKLDRVGKPGYFLALMLVFILQQDSDSEFDSDSDMEESSSSDSDLDIPQGGKVTAAMFLKRYGEVNCCFLLADDCEHQCEVWLIMFIAQRQR